jgi:hypothetical protein
MNVWLALWQNDKGLGIIGVGSTEKSAQEMSLLVPGGAAEEGFAVGPIALDYPSPPDCYSDAPGDHWPGAQVTTADGRVIEVDP